MAHLKKIKNVFALFKWLAELALDREVLGLIPASNNLISRFPSRIPPKYCRGPMLLNFSVRKGLYQFIKHAKAASNLAQKMILFQPTCLRNNLFIFLKRRARKRSIFNPNPLASLLLKDVLGRSSMTMVYIFSTLNINLVQRKMKKTKLGNPDLS